MPDMLFRKLMQPVVPNRDILFNFMKQTEDATLAILSRICYNEEKCEGGYTMNGEVQIVCAQPEHLEAAADIAIRAWTLIHVSARKDLGDELHDALFSDWAEQKRASVVRELTGERGYVAIMEGRVVGFISYRLTPAKNLGHIGQNAVDPDCRGRGIAPKMYEFVKEKMREEGMLYVTVHTGLDDGHAPARRAYEKAGFKRGRPSIDYYQEL